MYVKLLLLAPPYSILTYSMPPAFPPSFWHLGQRVAALVGKTPRTGVICEIAAESGLPPDIKCKPLCWPLETRAMLGNDILALTKDLAKRQGIEQGFILGHVLPQGLRTTKATVVWHNNRKKLVFSFQQIAAMESEIYASLAQAFLAGSAVISKAGAHTADMEICSIAIDPPWPLRPAAKKQIALLDFLYTHGRSSRGKLLKVLGQEAMAPLRKLAEKGFIRIDLEEAEQNASPELMPPPDLAFELNDCQKAALTDLTAAVRSDLPQNRLLYGVTGSGKTAVYLALARVCLEAGKSIMLLAPEVALAHKLYLDVCASLPDLPHYLYHGYQTQTRREKVFRQLAAANKPVIVIGTRSALFLPVYKPGCIILDEEHDSSYKQDEVFAYHAKELAWFRMREARGLLVLGSATPDIRTFHASQTGALPVLRLPKRASGKTLPPVELVQLGSRTGVAAGSENASLLAPECEEALNATLAAGEQAVILLNRRGYAPLIYCPACESVISCPNCQIGMAYHKGIGKLVCHYCGYDISWPSACPACGGNNFIAIGEGTERVAERLETIAGQPVLRLDRDSARRTGGIEEILTAFANGQSPYLVGTQMLSKGHHFPNVTLVVVADGDIGLNLPDYRSAERTFQLLAQAAGRAGRGDKPGRALIQTRNPGHYCWRHIVNYSYEGFYEEELALRKKYRYPPFTRLGLLRISLPGDNAEAQELARQLGYALRQKAKEMGTILLGPAPAPMAMLKGMKRFHCMIKAGSWEPMRDLWFFAQKTKGHKEIQVFLDLDPVNMM